MAKRTKRGGSAVRVIEKSLNDAQKLVASYISSGSDQVTDTIKSLRKIFDNRQLATALKKAREARMVVAGAVSGRGRAKTKRKPTSAARRKTKARRATPKSKAKAPPAGGRRARG